MSLKLFDLTGKKILVTGGYQGLGNAIAKGLGEAGAELIINGRSQEKLDKSLKEFEEWGIKAHGALFDVTETEDVEKGIDKIESDIGPIDVLVNNAGVIRRAPLEEFPDEEWDLVIKTNLTGPYKVGKAVAKRMIKRKKGKIINMNSMMSELGRPNVAAYAASKGGIKMLTKNMAAEWTKHNIQCNGIGPGYFKTELTDNLPEEFKQFIRDRTPAGRWGDPSELVGAAIYLSAEASDFVSGHILYVDGGILAVL